MAGERREDKRLSITWIVIDLALGAAVLLGLVGLAAWVLLNAHFPP